MIDKTESGFSETRPFTAVFRGLTADEAGEIVNHPKWSAGSWSHALDDRDAARAAQAASQPKALTDEQIMQIWFDDEGHSSMDDALISFARLILEASK